MKRILIALAFAMLFFESLAQITSDTVINDIGLWQSIPHEKIYLHLNKPYYSAGDTIWYKVYLVDANTHLMDSSLSKVIYLDFVKKESGQIYRHDLLKNSIKGASGAIVLPDTIKAGVFEVNAYTNLMKNFLNHSFQKEVFIYDAISRSAYGQKEDLDNLTSVGDLQFFPEGGNLISGSFNRVAFKAVNKLGKGIDVSINVVSDKGDTVATGKSQHLGMGKFTFAPQPNRTYHAVLKKIRSNQKFNLPKVEEKGFVMLLDNFGNQDAIKIIIRNNFPAGEKPFVVGHQRGKIFYVAQSGAISSISSFLVPRKDIPDDGIVHFTVFNSQGVPSCERLVYNRLNQPIQVMLKPDKTDYSTRQKVEIEIETSDYLGNAFEGNYSLSITDASQVIDAAYPETIETYFLLSSDVKSSSNTLSHELRGGIENPGYYFTSTEPNVLNNLDLLLMTQGWRRFNWTDVLNIKNQAFQYVMETGISIKGKGQLENRNKVLQQPLNIIMTVWKKGGNEFQTTESDLSGDFFFSDLDIVDSTQVLIQGRREKGKSDLDIKLITEKNEFYKPVNFPIDPLISQWNDSYDKSLEEYWKGINKSSKNKVVLLQAVEVKAKREIPDDRKRMYGGGNFQTVNIENENCGATMATVLRARVAGLTVSGYPPNEVFTIRGRQAEFVLDGNLLPLDFINTVQPCNLEEIDVFHMPVAGLGTGSLPVIAMLTKMSNPNYDWSKQKSPGVLVTKIMGYQKQMEFYSPVYDLAEQEGDHATDFRSALYWNPSITTDKTGKAKIVFWNSDSKSKFNVHLEGISNDGKVVAKTWSYSVN